MPSKIVFAYIQIRDTRNSDHLQTFLLRITSKVRLNPKKYSYIKRYKLAKRSAKLVPIGI
jgi:hypothetical protein